MKATSLNRSIAVFHFFHSVASALNKIPTTDLNDLFVMDFLDGSGSGSGGRSCINLCGYLKIQGKNVKYNQLSRNRI